jgi:hypothetical protein
MGAELRAPGASLERDQVSRCGRVPSLRMFVACVGGVSVGVVAGSVAVTTAAGVAGRRPAFQRPGIAVGCGHFGEFAEVAGADANGDREAGPTPA